MNDIPYLTRRNQHKIGKAGRASEQRLTRELHAKSRPASGAMEGAKGDLQVGRFPIEAKSTTQVNMTLKHGWFAKIGKEARSEAKTPALAISFINEDGSAKMDGDWVAVPRYKFEEWLAWQE